jgi:uncharacterized membrane protein YeaQ/YmgE (transglycosylase-associated protein family)
MLGLLPKELKFRASFSRINAMKTNPYKSAASIALGMVTIASAARANDSFNAELSHFAGNAAIAGITTVAVDKYAPKVKKPALAGFLVSTAEIVAGECIDKASGHGFSLLDVAVGTVGAAAGAYATDKWYITPRVNTQKGETTCSVAVSHRF